MILIKFILAVFIILSFILWIVHLLMLEGNRGKASYKVFKKHFLETNWKSDPEHKFSLFGVNRSVRDTCINASIFKFNGICMRFGYFTFWRVQLFLLWNRKKYFVFEKETTNYKWS